MRHTLHRCAQRRRARETIRFFGSLLFARRLLWQRGMNRHQSTLSTKAIPNHVLAAALGLLASLAPVGCLVASGDPANAGQDPSGEGSSVKGASESAPDASAESYTKGLANLLRPELPWVPRTWEGASPDAGFESHPNPTISRPMPMPSPLLGPWQIVASDDGGAPDGAPESDFVRHIVEVEERQ